MYLYQLWVYIVTKNVLETVVCCSTFDDEGGGVEGCGGVEGGGGEHLLPLSLLPLWLPHGAYRFLWDDWKATTITTTDVAWHQQH